MTKDNIQPDMMADKAANNRRIAKNTLMLYARMLVGMCGLAISILHIAVFS